MDLIKDDALHGVVHHGANFPMCTDGHSMELLLKGVSKKRVATNIFLDLQLDYNGEYFPEFG